MIFLILVGTAGSYLLAEAYKSMPRHSRRKNGKIISKPIMAKLAC